MKKKFWIAGLAALMAFTFTFGLAACGGNGDAEDGEHVEEVEKETEGLKYELTEDKAGFAVTGVESDAITELFIPSKHLDRPVTEIADKAFFNCVLLESITLPDTLTAIGSDVFDNTVYYETAKNWKNNVLYIGNYLIGAKEDISGIYRVLTGTRVIAESAFWYHEKLTEVIIPDSVVTIGDGAFGGCSALTKVTIGDGVKTIGRSAFYGCSKLETVEMGKSVETIGHAAFQGCGKLTSIVIPATVTHLGDWAFADCNGLAAVYITDIKAWCEIKSDYYNSNPLFYAKKLYLNGELVTEVVIPEGTTKIGKYAFQNCEALTHVEIPHSMAKIEGSAFKYCNLESILYHGSLQDWYSIEKDNDYSYGWDSYAGEYTITCDDYFRTWDGKVTKR